MSKTRNIFQRVEKKYLLSGEIYHQLLQRIQPYVTSDEYGFYSIYNIYYDTVQYDLIRHSIEKPSYKEKLRLRSYQIPDDNDTVFLELKKKFNGVVYKRRISLTLKEAEDYLERHIKPDLSCQIFNEIDYFVNFYNPESKLFLAYDRAAFTGMQDPCVRITFDHNIRSRPCDLSLGKGDYGGLILSPSLYLMEIKVLCAMPLWLVNILSDLKIYPVSFSKYGNIYEKSFIEKRRDPICLRA